MTAPIIILFKIVTFLFWDDILTDWVTSFVVPLSNVAIMFGIYSWVTRSEFGGEDIWILLRISFLNEAWRLRFELKVIIIDVSEKSFPSHPINSYPSSGVAIMLTSVPSS